MVDGMAVRVKAISLEDDSWLFETYTQPVLMINNDKVAIMNTDLDLIAYGIVDNSDSCKSEFIPKVQEDLFDYLGIVDLFHEQCNRQIVLNDDLPVVDIDIDDIFDTDAMIGDMTFNRTIYELDYIPIELEKDTTSVSITNPLAIFSRFTNNDVIMKQTFKEFSIYVKTKFKLLQNRRVTIGIESTRIVYQNVKKTTKDFYVQQFNTIIKEFITNHFTCPSCKAVGSIFKTKDFVKCNACSAVTSQI